MIDDRYPSRTQDAERILQRQEPVVYSAFDEEGYLSKEQLQFFDENGYLILEGLLKDKVQDLLNELPKLKHALKGQEELILEPDTEVVRSIFSPDKYSELYFKLACSRPLLSSAKQILNDDVYIHHSRINIKSGFDGKSFTWHSDFETWHTEDAIPGMRMLTGWVFLTENNEYNGSLFVIPGSHKKFISCVGATPDDNYKRSLRKQVLGVPGKETMQELVKEHGIKGVYGPPGTVVFHECNLMHGSPDNISPFDRTNLFFVYNSLNNQPLEDHYLSQKRRPDFLARRDVVPLYEEKEFA
ncbi:phytanoyl-CoA dioxygenase [Legionella israelensis]|uniref:phytanoyl-CoA dioxygenase family protein n=1 Tax=Legionella israelensis TaxID=454 RepID=UPI00117D5116|nr:phytanoyl-CoA dioxygenase family protein [Legionella israelensis]QDP72963.1 phytanoyl-CoA dioxygenase [Legionella israelensis]